MSGTPNDPPPKRQSVSRRWVAAGVLVTCAAVLIGVGVGIAVNSANDSPAPSGGALPSGSVVPSATGTPSGTSPSSGAATPASDPVTIGIIGDSWSTGMGSAGGSDGSFAVLAAEELGWDSGVFAGAGTGYLQPNALSGEEPFADRVDELIAFAPDVVVIQGSSNDSLFSAEEIEAAAEQLFGTITKALPDATVYALGVITSPAANDAMLAASREGVSAAAAATGVTYIDPIGLDWVNLETDFADGLHPNTAGHAKVGHGLAVRLDPELGK
jgi:lysophospholipase L1-like esterase